MSRKSWDGVELMAALRSGADRLEARVAEVNALNVFPVPDGDTGTNMLATLKAAIAEGEATLATGITSIDEVSEAVARGALLGARGNSGVLLSQILRGLPQAVRGRKPPPAATVCCRPATTRHSKAVSDKICCVFANVSEGPRQRR